LERDFLLQSIHGLSHNSESFQVVLRAKVGNQDYSKASKNFYTATGQVKGSPGRKVAGSYNLEYHLAKTMDKESKKRILELVKQYSMEEGVTISYSQRRICFKKGLTFMRVETKRTGIKVH
jgi:hypothetical protein